MNPFFKIVLMIFFSLSSYLSYHEIYIDTSNLLLQTKKTSLSISQNVRISLLNLYIKDIPSKQHTRTIHIFYTQPSLVKASTD